MSKTTRITTTVLALVSTAAACRGETPSRAAAGVPRAVGVKSAPEVALARASLDRARAAKVRVQPPKKEWVWLPRQGVWGYGYQLADGPHQGLWRIDAGSKRAPEEVEPPAGDPYGFGAILNRYRAALGLPAVAYDQTLSAWAARNNAAQHHRGIGHHVNPNCHQNCAYNTQDVASTAQEWMNSPGHRANLLAPAISRFGIAFGPGPYWTMNAQ